MVGFLQWADQHNYKPWVHLNGFSQPIYDPVVHTQGEDTTFTMMSGKEIGFARDAQDPFGYHFPGQPKLEDGKTELEPRKYEFSGTGIWEHYFEPVSDFAPGDPSCEGKPYVVFDISRVVPGIHSQAPFAPHGKLCLTIGRCLRPAELWNHKQANTTHLLTSMALLVPRAHSKVRHSRTRLV